jgi:hypothetical protein
LYSAFRKTMHSATVLVVCAALRAAVAAEVAEVWEGQPYRIQASLAIDAPGDLAQQLAGELPGYLSERAAAAIGSVWRLDVEPVNATERHQVLANLESQADPKPPEIEGDKDKLLLLAIRDTPWGYDLSAREFDCYLNRWGPVIRRTVRQRAAVPEQLFALAKQAIAPLAHLEIDAGDTQRVEIKLRGADLPPNGAGDFHWLEPGDALEPRRVRTTRDGAVVKNGVTSVPWTYIEAMAPAENSTQLIGRIHSASPRPLGVRRGRIELVAIGMRHDREASTLELRSRAEPDKPLVGYEVFAQIGDQRELQLVGKSDAAGNVRVDAGEAAVRMLYLKSDGVTLARLPVVPGAEARVVVPLADDEMRLRAAARLSSLREDIVDVVARRTIFMARVRQQIEEKNFDAARELLSSLDDLPGTTQFRLSLDRDAQMLQTNDAQVQRRIDKLFSNTRNLLGKFLNPRPIGSLHEELRQAELANPKSDDS